MTCCETPASKGAASKQIHTVWWPRPAMGLAAIEAVCVARNAQRSDRTRKRRGYTSVKFQAVSLLTVFILVRVGEGIRQERRLELK